MRPDTDQPQFPPGGTWRIHVRPAREQISSHARQRAQRPARTTAPGSPPAIIVVRHGLCALPLRRGRAASSGNLLPACASAAGSTFGADLHSELGQICMLIARPPSTSALPRLAPALAKKYGIHPGLPIPNATCSWLLEKINGKAHHDHHLRQRRRCLQFASDAPGC